MARCHPAVGAALAVIVPGKVAFPSDANEVVFLHANHHCNQVNSVIPPSVVRYRFSPVVAGIIPISVAIFACLSHACIIMLESVPKVRPP